MQRGNRAERPNATGRSGISLPGRLHVAHLRLFVGALCLSIATAMALATFVRPGSESPVPEAAADQPAPAVTRADFGLLQMPPPRFSAASQPARGPVSLLLRRPVRVTDTAGAGHDLGLITAAVLARFGHVAGPDDALQGLLVATLAQGQSDAYIDAALNAALARGEFAAPIALAAPGGALATQVLLAALLDEAGV